MKSTVVLSNLSSISCILDFYYLLKSSVMVGSGKVNVSLQKGVILSALKEAVVLCSHPSEQTIAASFVPNESGQFSSNLQLRRWTVYSSGRSKLSEPFLVINWDSNDNVDYQTNMAVESILPSLISLQPLITLTMDSFWPILENWGALCYSGSPLFGFQSNWCWKEERSNSTLRGASGFYSLCTPV